MLADKNYVDNKSCLDNMTNKYNEWEGGDFSVNEEHDQNRMLAKKSLC